MNWRKASLEEWKSIVENSSESTFFHTPEWYIICKKMKYFRSIETILLMNNGVQAILPLCSKGRRLIKSKRYISSPLGTYGGVVFTNKQQFNDGALIKELTKFQNLTIYGNPFNQNSIKRNIDKGFTQCINLKKMSSIEDLNQWSNNHKRSLNKSKSLNLFIHQTESVEDWNNYFSIYKRNILERGTLSSNAYTDKLFKLIYKLDSSLRSLFVVKHDDKILSGGLIFHYYKKCHYWHGASLAKGKIKKAGFFLFYNILEFAKRNNYEYFDFMSSNGNEGVVRFKKGFGATKVEYPIFRN